jgi:hypothetical protein
VAHVAALTFRPGPARRLNTRTARTADSADERKRLPPATIIGSGPRTLHGGLPKPNARASLVTLLRLGGRHPKPPEV